MSGTNTTEKRLQDIEVVSSLTGLRILATNNASKPFAIEAGAFNTGGGGGTGGDGPALSDAVPLGLNNPAAPGTSPTAARSDHRHPIPTTAQLGAAAAIHTHAVADVTGLQNALDTKSPTTHTHTINQVSALQSSLDGKAAAAHTHAQSDISGLTASLAATEKLVNKGAANGYAPLDSSGKVPAANLPTTIGGTGGSNNFDNGTITGQIAVWDNVALRGRWQTPSSVVLDRTQTVERNSATVLSFAEYNRRNILLTGNASLSLAASEVGTAPLQGMEFLILNNHTAINTITFGAGITVNAFPAGTGTAGAVKVASKGAVAVTIVPAGTSLIAWVRGQVA